MYELTNKLRWYKSSYDSDPVLQQWWTSLEGGDEYGYWEDVPYVDSDG